jgi:hypothetical protein
VLRIGASTWADQVHVQVAVKVHDDVNDNARPPLTSAGALSGASDSWIRVYVTVFREANRLRSRRLGFWVHPFGKRIASLVTRGRAPSHFVDQRA